MLGPLMKICDSPPTSVTPAATVMDAVHAMVAARVGAVAVLDGERLRGIFTERDLMRRVVAEGRDPRTTRVADVMVGDPVSVGADTTRERALDLMMEHHFRHLPVVDAKGRAIGMVSIRNLLRHQVVRLSEDVRALEQYLAADGPGG
jgi:CBS domain-containing protein